MSGSPESPFLDGLFQQLMASAPCPPPWNQDLLWTVTQANNINDTYINQIAGRCNAKQSTDPGVVTGETRVYTAGCDLTCLIILICTIAGVLLLVLIGGIIFWMKKPRSRRRPFHICIDRSPSSASQNQQLTANCDANVAATNGMNGTAHSEQEEVKVVEKTEKLKIDLGNGNAPCRVGYNNHAYDDENNP